MSMLLVVIFILIRSQTPEDVFTSDHVVNVFAPFVKATAGTVYNYGYLGGGLAMTLTGVRLPILSLVTASHFILSSSAPS